MNTQYEAFCVADPNFYDAPGARDEPVFAAATREPPDGWTRARLGPWTVLRPPRPDLPQQGWKVHVTACLDNAEHILALVWGHCTARGVTFKFLAGPRVHLLRNSKYAAREGSGKLVTIYPRDERELQRVCEDLAAELAGQPGPYILSDLRVGAGPLHVRYGAFTERLCPGPAGDLVPAVERPDGTLVPDSRRPVFAPPDWVEIPPFLRPHLDVPAAAMPYHVTGALHFSNGGGVYLAQREGEPPVVLKEARPHAGLDCHGADAVTRLAHEADVLNRLDGIGGIPRLRERFTVWEHHYLAMEYVEGGTLGQWMARNYPLSRCEPGPAEIAGYTDRAVALLERVERLLAAVHARGIVYGDLHPRNVLVGADDRVALVDFELASPVHAPVRPGLGAAGFTAPADRTGTRVDRYALAALRLFLFLPLGAVLALEPSKLTGYLADVDRRFPVPPGFTESIRRELAPAVHSGHRARARPVRVRHDWPAARDSLVGAVLASATPARRDRLFPGDVAQFTTGGLGLAHGAAGVLHALDAVGAGRFPAHEQWLLDAAAAAPPLRAGLYDGAAGLAWLLQRFGHHDAANRQLARLLDGLPGMRDTSLFRGLAGIGTALLDLAELRGDPQLANHAVALGHRAAAALMDRAAATPVPGRPARAGLMHGWSGPAVFFLALYRETGDQTWLDRAETAIGRDLDGCVHTADGTRQVSDAAGRRTLPYLDTGSAGIAVALAGLVPVRPQAAVTSALPELVRACELELVIQPGLFAGRAGLITALAAVRGAVRGPGPDGDRIARALDRHLDRLDWHVVRHRGRLAFPGDQLLRLSMDLATGSAGVLLAASAALDDHPGGAALLPGVPTTAAPVAVP